MGTASVSESYRGNKSAGEKKAENMARRHGHHDDNTKVTPTLDAQNLPELKLEKKEEVDTGKLRTWGRD